MTVDRHLVLQEITLPPAAEQFPKANGWVVVRVLEGDGYWLQRNQSARRLGAGDMLVTAPGISGVVRASALGVLKLQFFFVQPQLLTGLLTVAEWQQLEAIAANAVVPALVFASADTIAQKFSRLVENPAVTPLALRCRLLQLWADAMVQVLPAIAPENNDVRQLRERFRELVGRMPSAELCARSLGELAGQVGCSERHFRRLFREEFGVSLRVRQTELRLLRARQFLTESDAKITSIAFDSGYHHLGLFNSMFKKHFGMTPSEWRRTTRKSPPPPRKTGARISLWLLLLLGNFLSWPAFSQTNALVADSAAVAKARAALMQKMQELDKQERDAKVHHVISTNAGPRFTVDKYLISGNSVLTPGTIGGVFTNVPEAYGTNVSFDAVQAALGDLQQAYRDRGFVTASVTLPQQQLTNATVKVKVTEAPLAVINVTGNRYYSSNNVMRALPSLRAGKMLNSFVLKNELDAANANRDRQIYPVLGPGPEPGTSALTLKVRDRLPLHARLELNNQATPNTPDLRVNLNAQYGNLWDLDHQIGFQYGFSPQQLKSDYRNASTPFDDPLIANYSAYYRLPLGNVVSAQDQIDARPNSFGYNEATHQFQLPPSSGRPDVTFYASRSTVDTGIQYGEKSTIVSVPLLTVISQDTGENTTLNENIGGKLNLPLRLVDDVSLTLSFGFDFKRYRLTSLNTNNFYETITTTNQFGSFSTNYTVSSGQPPYQQGVDYLPLNVGFMLAVPDPLGTTFFNAAANFNIFHGLSDDAAFANAAGDTNSVANYFTATAGLSRDQKIFGEWLLAFRANGQWTDQRLVSNERFALGGVNSVRGYREGEEYGDCGWRISGELRTPYVSIGTVKDNDYAAPFWLRGVAFMDYGQVFALDVPEGTPPHLSLWGTGVGGVANIGDNIDVRVNIAWALENGLFTHAGDMGAFFTVGVQF